MRLTILGLLVTAAGLASAQAPALKNAGFEEMSPEGRPVGWSINDFRTGGQGAVQERDPHTGARCVVLRSTTPEQRSAWTQKIPWPTEQRSITVGGWYRTVGVEAAPGRGASLRLLFHRSAEKWDEIGLQQAFFPASPAWAPAQATFQAPPDTRAVVLEVFHWLTPGETLWDDVWVRPATAAEMQTAAIPPAQALDREPVLGRNKPYSPADGETVSLNPPPFLWLPSGTGVTYRLEVAREPTFAAADTLRQPDLAWCCAMLTAPLEPGAWHWRYGVDTGIVPTVWSRPRRFVVPATATPWAYPGRDSFQVPTARPRLFVRAGRLPELRQRATNGDLKSMADSLAKTVRAFAGEELIAEPAFLPKGGQERSQAYATIIRTTRPPMDRMEQAALAYLLSGDPACGAEAKRRLLHFFAWDPKGSTRVTHNDEPAMWIMMRGVRAYDWTWELCSPAERTLIETSMRVRATDFFDLLRRKPYDNNPYESHAGRIIGFLGEAALELLPEVPEARTWLDYIVQIYWGVYPAWGGNDGGWNEGPGYWAAYMSFALHFVVALREATGVDLSQRPFFHNTPYYRLYLTPPYSQMAPFGDGAQFAASPAPDLMYWFSTLTQDAHLRWYADEQHRGGGNSILGIVLKDDALQGQPPVELPQARLFAQVGLACLHTDFANGADDVAFSLRASPYGAVSHGHNDQNCFVLEAFGEPLAIATGHYNYYGSEHHDQWTRQTKAKCGITFDGGQGQDRGWQAQGRITAFVSGEGFDLVSGDATPAYGGRLSRAGRDVVQVRPGLFVLRDDLASATPRRFEFRLHALDQMRLDASAGTALIQRPKASLLARFLAPPGIELTQTDQFDTPVAWPPDKAFGNQWHLTAALPQAAAACEFLTVLSPARAGEEAQRPAARLVESESAHGVELRFADGSSTLVGFARAGWQGPLTLADVVCDGRLFAVSRNRDGQPRAWLLAAGRQLRAAAMPLVQAATAMDLTAAVAADGGRLDSAGPGGAVTLGWPSRAGALTRAGAAVAAEIEPAQWSLTLAAGQDSLLVWPGTPVPPAALTVRLTAAGGTCELRGQRYGRGQCIVSGRALLPRGAYRATPLPGVRLSGPHVDEQGRLWLTGDDTLRLSGPNLPPQVDLEAAVPAVALPALALDQLPAGLVFEAERNWRESGGKVQLSGGTHAGASGNDNLWAWNLPGHALSWDLEVPTAGRYQVWFVAATEAGLLAEFQVDQGTAAALWFAPSGGWARSNAGEWRAFQVRTAVAPLELDLAAGQHRLTLTNRFGMGLNLDRIVLVPR
jgi:hypothetical protein